MATTLVSENLPYRGIPGFVADSDTSEDAALSIDASSKRAKCLELIDGSGTRGLTCDEIEQRLGWRHQTVSARLRELVLMDQIRDTGVRRATRSGRNARVYRLCERVQNVAPTGLGGLFSE